MPEWLKKIIGTFSTAESIRGIVTSPLIWPWVSGAVGAVLAYLDGYDKTAIYLAALASFAFVGGGLLWFEERRSRRSAENKLVSAGYTFHRDFTPQIDGEVRIEYAQMGLAIVNSADFPISVVAEFVTNEIIRRAEGHVQRIQPGEAYIEQRHILAPQNGMSLRGKRIHLGGADCRSIEGEMTYRVRYGRPGKEKYLLRSPWPRGVTARFNPADGSTVAIVWSLDPRAPTQ